ncbi:MAG: RidA family protein, partial [Burkholderiales bacterium]|nr:RidA family protein [Burkholderiales bacterium]
YITDPRFFIPHFEKCKNEEYGGAGAPLPAQTLVVTAGLANAAMLVEIDITAVVPK